jgi:protein-S-isoprenylcysteine O-methyltransferase Ste14
MRSVRLVAGVLVSAIGASVLIGRAPRLAAVWTGVIVLLVSACLVAVSRLQLGGAFTWGINPQARFLVTHGLYSRIPHPMLVFILLALLGVVMMLRRQWLVLCWLACTLEAAWHASREARVLERTFGERYREYRRHTWW